MHHYVLGLFLTFSIALPGIAGIIRFRQILWDYYPFLFLIFLGLANELVSIISIHISGTNAINGNVYVLLEYILLLYQFLKWNFSHDSYVALDGNSRHTTMDYG